MSAKRKPGVPATRLDAILDSHPREPKKPRSKDKASTKKRAQAGSQEAEKVERPSFYVKSGLMERLRDAAYLIPGTTMNSIVIEAIERELRRLEKKHNEGEPFPARKGDLPRGRRPR